MPTETTAYLSLGSNMGKRTEQLESALTNIAKIPTTRIVAQSPVYEGKAWGKTDQPDYLNIAVEIATTLDPQQLLRHCKDIETRQGREPGERWGPRPIDIDILLFGNRRLKTASLVVPHPHMWERAFVLRPLADIAPTLRHDDGTHIEDYLKKKEIASQELHPYTGD
jgi:2-amino-4-hydroxy-6-hydroxymethyldihydropteridine diphosphokinase